MHRIFEVGREIAGALEQLLFFEHVETGERGRARKRMAGVGIAVKELDGVFGRRRHHAVVNALAHHHCAHRHAAVGEALGETQYVGDHAEFFARERRTQAAEAGNDFVEYQQDAMLVANFTQPLEIALWRHQHARRAGERLDDHGRDVGGVMQRNDAVLQFVGEMRAPRGLAAAE